MQEIKIQVSQPKSKFSVQELENCVNQLLENKDLDQIKSEYISSLFEATDRYAADKLMLPTSIAQLSIYLMDGLL